MLPFFALRAGERERPRLCEERAGGERRRPEEPPDEEEDELELDESESEPVSEPLLLEPLSPRSESEELADRRRLDRLELRDRR